MDISWLESLTLEGRATYYDKAGALKDMVQNHLMEAMALVLMEQPARLDADSFRGTRVEALRAVATPQAETMRNQTIRARYTAGTIGNRQVPSYVDEPGVDRSRNTETYASLTVEVNSSRWAGVPFTLRSGKALAADSAEIAIHFRGTCSTSGPVPNRMCSGSVSPSRMCGWPPPSTARNAQPGAGNSRHARHRPGSPRTPT